MKKAICVSVDIDTWIVAKDKVNNISEYLNECLKGLSGKTKEQQTIDELNRELESLNAIIQEANIKQSVLKESIKAINATKALKDQQNAENELYLRWKCPVCQKLNFMEQDRCNGCSLKTKNDKKTEIVNTKE